jgi:hypothetical protein
VRRFLKLPLQLTETTDLSQTSLNSEQGTAVRVTTRIYCNFL